MPDHSRAVLVVSVADRTCRFTFRNNLRIENEFQRSFLLGDRGGLINEIARRLESDEEGDESGANARESFWLDGGSGTKAWTLTADVIANTDGGEALTWGDGSSDPNDPEDTTLYDATGSNPVSQAQVFSEVLAEARTDSQSPAVLHIGEFSDGSEIEAGVFLPINAIVKETDWRKESEDRPSAVTVSTTLQSAASVEDIVDSLENDLR